jgi:hypothetical protein
VKHQDLSAERERNRKLRKEVEELCVKVTSLASINEVLIHENRDVKAKKNNPRAIDMHQS